MRRFFFCLLFESIKMVNWLFFIFFESTQLVHNDWNVEVNVVIKSWLMKIGNFFWASLELKKCKITVKLVNLTFGVGIVSQVAVWFAMAFEKSNKNEFSFRSRSKSFKILMNLLFKDFWMNFNIWKSTQKDEKMPDVTYEQYSSCNKMLH